MPFLQVRGLAKHFGGVQALKGVDLDIAAGEVHGLVGANGAGKSTLIRLLAGLYQPDAGSIMVDGKPVTIVDPEHASEIGLNFIHQDLNLVPKFNAIENMTLGLPKASRFGLITWGPVRRQVEEVARRLGVDFPLDIPVETLSVANQWLISIGRALVRRARLIAMDEPTASLSAEEAGRLFQIIRELSSDGIAILYVSHRLDEIMDLCDRVTVFKDGVRVLRTDRAAMTKGGLVRAIVGCDVAAASSAGAPDHGGPVVLETRHLGRGIIVRDVSLQLHAGEVLGLAGLVGAGRSELVRLIFGADRADTGTILLDGAPWRPAGPHDAFARGIGFIPEERRSQGLVLQKDVSFNINLADLRPLRYAAPIPLISLSRAARRAKEVAHQLQIKTPRVTTPVIELSGGNQQKVVIGKWLTRHLRVLILDEPSRGVDVGARAEIHRIIKELAAGGVGVIVISSEVEELPDLCNRVLVMVEGRVAGELTGREITKEAILQLSYAHGQGATTKP
ncbi:MAG: sugar ABC transporter ATP-binding protein [Chloroflexota bacterium]